MASQVADESAASKSPDVESGQPENPAVAKKETQEVSVSLMKLCTVPMFVFGLLAQIYIYGGIGFLSPTFSLHMSSTYEGFDEFWVSIYFAMPAVAYIINTPLTPTWCAKFGRKNVLLVGSLLFTLAISMIGTSPMLGMPDNPTTIFLGVIVLGFSACMVTIPVLPEVLHKVE